MKWAASLRPRRRQRSQHISSVAPPTIRRLLTVNQRVAPAGSPREHAETLPLLQRIRRFPWRGFSLCSTSGCISPLRLDTVAELNPGAHERDEMCAVDPPPAALGHGQELEGHQQAFLARARPLRHSLAQPHGCKGRLDHGRHRMTDVRSPGRRFPARSSCVLSPDHERPAR